MANGPLVLRDEKTATDRRSLWVRVTDDGVLRIEGQDLGDSVEHHFGDGIREYEWSTEVNAEDLPRLVAALGGAAGANVLDVIRATCTADPALLERTIREADIPRRFWNRMGD